MAVGDCILFFIVVRYDNNSKSSDLRNAYNSTLPPQKPFFIS